MHLQYTGSLGKGFSILEGCSRPNRQPLIGSAPQCENRRMPGASERILIEWNGSLAILVFELSFLHIAFFYCLRSCGMSLQEGGSPVAMCITWAVTCDSLWPAWLRWNWVWQVTVMQKVLGCDQIQERRAKLFRVVCFSTYSDQIFGGVGCIFCQWVVSP